MAQKNIGGSWTREDRNTLNGMFTELYNETNQLRYEFNSAVEEVSGRAFGKVVGAARLNWKEPVDTVNDLPEDAKEGETRMVRETGKVYRFDNSTWAEIQQIDAGPVNEVDSRLTAQFNDVLINVKYPPPPLMPAKMDGQTDETDIVQYCLDYVEDKGGGKVFIPEGLLLFTVLYIPNNTILEGAGFQTEAKLPDNTPLVHQRIPTGIYPKDGVHFFGVRNLRYNGNALNNIDINELTNQNYNDFYAHGIANAYVDENTNTNDPEGSDQNRYAKDFLVENVHIHDTIRNCLLIGGRARLKGTVRDVTLENAYADHLIYESHTDSLVHYENIKLKGFWRGTSIVAETGKFVGLTYSDIVSNPVPNYKLGGIIDLRDSYNSPIKSKPIFEKLTLDIPFGDLFYIFSSQSSKPPKGATFDKVTINQTDKSSVGTLGVPLSVINSSGLKHVRVTGLEINNVMQINLLGLSVGSDDIVIDDVLIRYSPDRSALTFSDTLVSVSNNQGDIGNVTISNVLVPEKAPSILRYTKSGSNNVVNVENLRFVNVNVKRTTRAGAIFDVLANKTYFNSKRISIIDSSWTDYPPIDNAVRDEMGVSLINSYHNGIPSRKTLTIGLPQGQSSVTVPFPYITAQMSVMIATPRYDRGMPQPIITLASNQLTLTVSSPAPAYQEYRVLMEY